MLQQKGYIIEKLANIWPTPHFIKKNTAAGRRIYMKMPQFSSVTGDQLIMQSGQLFLN